ncbi:hypothetical protein Sjap_013816 [Stephania japonica]|uniref:ABC transporter domain-containing protein n=1 Tax=Stephania japonica TaxID=461633 RepID=A0AAP0IYP8_9MAGN
MARDEVLVPSLLLISFALLSLLPLAQCQDVDDEFSQTGNPVLVPLITDYVYEQLSNLTPVFEDEIKRNLGFCVKDVNADWNGAFNFTPSLGFLSSCIRKTRGDLTKRLCTAAEIKFYFLSSLQGGPSSSNYLKPNKNCNLTSWNPGCEPGWACSVDPSQTVELKNSKNMPARVHNCQVCCEGFFCPHGITCMIPCPLGAYCPLAKLNTSTGKCDPYNYQLPPGQPNHTCGGANVWADIGSSSEVFCSAGSYCPSTVQEVPCSSGHYCRTGSTSETKCFKLTSCSQNTANENIHAYGVMLLAALCTLLLIIYNCSDQVLTTRVRREAKSREAAARSVRETTRARERWRAAREATKQHAIGFQAKLSRKFSRNKSTSRSEEMEVLSNDKTGTADALITSMVPVVHNASQQSSSLLKSEKKETSDLLKMMKEIEENPDSNEGFNLGVAPEHLKKNKEAKDMHTHSQIFKYAYGQLEKERAQEQQFKDLTFSGVISMVTNTETKTRTRPLIEVAFKDLTLTLKGKKKHLLRCVTGKIIPGHVSAVMGPSGAGKTTFLNALAGKVTGCTMSGLILINGKSLSIHSYKKITGFVPQDDIVHGNLTVEENLWFSARCRLPANMPKADKVLIVERVIESLGLQSVRDSLVGTVEKRGISGGQRKRVNVGLEMVMEPSLLILDEPTSGLDSASSQLLLRALRREALEGVNICMVVHQPSYTLFKMFDDLILLAKGGLTVYHGPAKKVEEYFSGLGMNVPDRINPPDHFIDILEGIVKPSTSTDNSYKMLPIRWMLYKGYPIPPDMQQYVSSIASSSKDANPVDETSPADSGASDQSFVGDLWLDVRYNVELKRDHIKHNFLKSKDLSNRRTPGIFQQYRYFLGRVLKQRLRESRIQVVDYLILLLAGTCLGALSNVSDETFGALGYTYTVIAVSLLCKIAALRSFSLDKLVHWRERSAGMSSLAFFLSKDTIDHFNTIIKPLVYLSMFYFFNNPRSSFAENYVILLCLVYCVTGIAYALSIFLQPGPAQLWSVLLPVVLTLIATSRKGGIIKVLANLCYTKWALEAFVISNAERYSGVWLITRCASLYKSGYNLHDWGLCLSIMILYGVVSRVIAYSCLVIFHKK